MKRLTSIAAMALPVAVQAIEIEFQVPLMVRNVDPAATHVDVTCGSFGDGRFLNSRKTKVPLKGTTSKSFSGVVKVVVAWPGATVPGGTYRCAMSMLMPSGLSGFDTLHAAANTRVVTTIDGNFAELLTQSAADKVKGTKRLPNIPSSK